MQIDQCQVKVGIFINYKNSSLFNINYVESLKTFFIPNTFSKPSKFSAVVQMFFIDAPQPGLFRCWITVERFRTTAILNVSDCGEAAGP